MSTNSILSQMPIDLGDNLILRFARPNDVDALAEFNARVFEDEKIGVFGTRFDVRPSPNGESERFYRCGRYTDK